MTKTKSEMTDRMDERLAMLWYQVDRIGDCELREEIEEVSDRFMYPGDAHIGVENVERAHQVFKRVHERYTPAIQARLGLRLVACPNCNGKKVPDE